MFDTITLEMSLKPFKKTDNGYVKEVCKKLFSQWYLMLKDAKTISVMLWTADGSEILDYAGLFEQEFEWCKYIGNANNVEKWNKKLDPECMCLYWRNHVYTENPPIFTYGILKNIVKTIKEVCQSIFPSKNITVGTTFDPGCEFAVSDFKYNRHNEICKGASGHLICCYALLNADTRSYAAFPKGIPDKTPVGTFLGKQCAQYLNDMGFDYIWLSNGFGFGCEPWSTTGATFDGEKFCVENFEEVRSKVLKFWKLFNAECSNIQIRTRGTNFSLGIDYSTDGVPFYDIYKSNKNILPPPNSPWAALDGDFGLELMGYMSRIAQIPDDRYLFRYYIHDPWWANSPWYDRYEGKPHDIYLPMTVARFDENGIAEKPTDLSLLSVDNSYGEMPDLCAAEPLPHLIKAYKDAPDEPSPVMWLYPFEEYSCSRDEKILMEMFSGDWSIRTAINSGFPLCGVVSVESFIKSEKKNRKLYQKTVLVTPVPLAQSNAERILCDYVKQGGNVIFYGSTRCAGERFFELTKLCRTSGIGGNIEIKSKFNDFCTNEKQPHHINHTELTSNGLLEETLSADSEVQLFASAGERAIGICGEHFAWLRATSSNNYEQGQRLLSIDDPQKFFTSEILFRAALSHFGYDLRFEKPNNAVKLPVVMINRNNNAYIFSVYSPSTTVKTLLRFPLGMPVLLGYEAEIRDGYAAYHFPRAEHCECRAFVEQAKGIVSCCEIPPVSHAFRRRIRISGLEDATVRFFAEKYCENQVRGVLNSQVDMYFVGDEFEWQFINDEFGCYYEAQHITGSLVMSMPRMKGENSD